MLLDRFHIVPAHLFLDNRRDFTKMGQTDFKPFVKIKIKSFIHSVHLQWQHEVILTIHIYEASNRVQYIYIIMAQAGFTSMRRCLPPI